MAVIIIILYVIQGLILLAGFSLAFYVGYVMISFGNEVPYVPTPKKIAYAMVKAAEITAGEKICDLGSGNGKIIITAGKMTADNLIVGFERSIFLRFFSRFKIFFYPQIRKRISVVKRDFFNIDLSEFDVIFCFLTPGALRKLAPHFQSLKKGSRIICYMFHFDDYQGFNMQVVLQTPKDKIFVYTKE